MPMDNLRKAYRAEAAADESVAIALGHRDTARDAVRITLRNERLRQGIGLRAMARHIGCSAAHLSDIENGRRWSTPFVHLACERLGCLPTQTKRESRDA